MAVDAIAIRNAIVASFIEWFADENRPDVPIIEKTTNWKWEGSPAIHLRLFGRIPLVQGEFGEQIRIKIFPSIIMDGGIDEDAADDTLFKIEGEILAWFQKYRVRSGIAKVIEWKKFSQPMQLIKDPQRRVLEIEWLLQP